MTGDCDEEQKTMFWAFYNFVTQFLLHQDIPEQFYYICKLFLFVMFFYVFWIFFLLFCDAKYPSISLSYIHFYFYFSNNILHFPQISSTFLHFLLNISLGFAQWFIIRNVFGSLWKSCVSCSTGRKKFSTIFLEQQNFIHS